MLTTAKHFPGHGDTDSDSHAGVPVVEKTREQLDAVEIPPFQAAIRSGVDVIMTSHVRFTSLDSSGRIATESPLILKKLLRDELGFKGIVISDSLLMDGAGHSLDGKRAADLLVAGIDVLLDVPDPTRLVDELVTLIETGELSESVVNKAFDRIWTLKMKLVEYHGTDLFSNPESCVPLSPADKAAYARFAEEIGRIACGSLSDIPAVQDICVVHAGPDRSYNDPTLASIESLFSKQFDSVTFFDVPGSVAEREDFKELQEEIVARASEARLLIILVTAKPAAWQQFGLSENQTDLVNELLDISGAILVFSGLPIPEVDADRAKDVLCLYSDSIPSIRGLVSSLSGQPNVTP